MSNRPKATPAIVGQRLQFARALAGLSTAEAAQKLGIHSPSRLIRAEHPSHPEGITPRLLADTAQAYGVSADYLLGLSEDWEPDAEPRFFAELAELRQSHDSMTQRINQFLQGAAPEQADSQALARGAVSLADDLPVGGHQATAVAPESA